MHVAPAIKFSGVTQLPKNPEFKWSDLSEIVTVQEKHKNKAPNNVEQRNLKLLLNTKAAWIPDDAVDFKLHILSITHASSTGHRGVDSTWYLATHKSLLD